MARITLETVEVLEETRSLLGELVSSQDLGDHLVRRIRAQRQAIELYLDRMGWSTNAPCEPELVEHVKAALRCTERSAIARIRNRRLLSLCEWCGQRTPEEHRPGEGPICDACRRRRAEQQTTPEHPPDEAA